MSRGVLEHLAAHQVEVILTCPAHLIGVERIRALATKLRGNDVGTKKCHLVGHGRCNLARQ